MKERKLNEKVHYEIKFDENKSFVTIRTSGDLSFNSYQLILRELLADPKWIAGTNTIVDHRASSIETLALDDLKKISYLVKQLKDNLGHGGRCAIVVSNDAEFTKIAMWKIMTETVVGFKIEYFDSIETAEEWLYKI